MDMTKLSDEELKKLATELHCSIHVSECFGSRDVLMYHAALLELERRGYAVEEDTKLVILQQAVVE